MKVLFLNLLGLGWRDDWKLRPLFAHPCEEWALSTFSDFNGLSGLADDSNMPSDAAAIFWPHAKHKACEMLYKAQL